MSKNTQSPEPSPDTPTPTEPVTFDTVRQLALALPEVVETTAYGTPAFKVRKTLLARLKEDGETLGIKIEFGEREFRLMSDPEVFYVTPHYDGYPMILVRLAKIDRELMAELVHNAWRMVAPKTLLKQYPREARLEQDG
jgi:hypothetical protein